MLFASASTLTTPLAGPAQFFISRHLAATCPARAHRSRRQCCRRTGWRRLVTLVALRCGGSALDFGGVASAVRRARAAGPACSRLSASLQRAPRRSCLCASVTNRLWEMSDLVAMIEAFEAKCERVAETRLETITRHVLGAREIVERQRRLVTIQRPTDTTPRWPKTCWNESSEHLRSSSGS